jgi:hypothetical protein
MSFLLAVVQKVKCGPMGTELGALTRHLPCLFTSERWYWGPELGLGLDMNFRAFAIISLFLLPGSAQWAMADGNAATLGAVEGKAWIRGSDGIVAATPGLNLALGDRVLTGVGSLATVVQDQCTIIIEETAQYQLSETPPCPEGVAFLAVDGLQVIPANGESPTIYGDAPPPPPPSPPPGVAPVVIGISAAAAATGAFWLSLDENEKEDDPLSAH